MAKENLKEISYDFSIVLNDTGADLLKNERNILKKLCDNEKLDINICSVIRHDQDIDEEINQLKTLHYHCAVRCNRKLMVSSLIKEVVNTFHINENQISVKKLSSLESYTRYLIHLDNGDKYQYMPFDIVSNNQKYVNDCLTKMMIRDERHCLGIVQRFHYKYEEIITNVVNWKKYNSLIKDFIRMRNI